MSTRQTSNLYRIFLLTVWQEGQNDWRFLLEDPRSGERKGFLGAESLVNGLQDMVDGNAQSTDSDEHLDSA